MIIFECALLTRLCHRALFVYIFVSIFLSVEFLCMWTRGAGNYREVPKFESSADRIKNLYLIFDGARGTT